MIRNHLKMAWRSLWHQRQYSLINITGLGVGICCVILITLYVTDERSYDRYHHGADRIYRITRIQTNSDGQAEDESRTVKAVAYTLRRDMPEVEAAATIFQSRQLVVQYQDKQFYEGRVYEADSNFFDVFDFNFIHGSASDVMKTTHSVVITKSIARKYFGTSDVLGKVIRCEGTDLAIEGIIEDVPSNSHFHFDFLIPLRTFEEEHNTQWLGMRGYYTYVKLREHSDPVLFETKLQQMAVQNDPKSSDHYFIQPLVDIHLTSKLKGELEQNGDKETIRILVTIAFIVIFVACINYVNLATARSIKRAKEVGVRKTSGARQGTLVWQFLTESIITVSLSFCAGVILLVAFLPAFNNMTGKVFTLLSNHLATTWVGLAGGALVLGLISGLYPALYLSSLDPAKVLKTGATVPSAGATLRKTLVLLQFVISIGLLISTITITRQIDFLVNKAPGFDKDLVIVINNAGAIPGREVIEEKIEHLAGVESVGASTTMPGVPAWSGNIRVDHSQADRLIDFSQIDYEYLQAMGIHIMAGRNFSRDFPIDTVNTIILNETAVRELNLANPVGQRMIWDSGSRDTTLYATVVGVVNDFHYASFREPIKPFALIIRNNFFVAEDFTSRLFVRTSNADQSAIVDQIENLWREFVPGRPFTYTYMDDSFRQWHEGERKFKDVFTLFTVLSLFIAGIGLFGLVTFISEQRRKEIGIRKVLGATMSNIVVLINKEFVTMIGIALLVATPAGWYFANRWLEGFAYHSVMAWWVFALAGISTLVMALISTAPQSFRASTANPVESIRAD